MTEHELTANHTLTDNGIKRNCPENG